MSTLIPTRDIGTSCPWRLAAPVDMTPIARDLEAARTRPHVRAMLAARAGILTPPEPSAPAAPETVTFAGVTLDAPGFSSDQFERAILRAFVDDLQLHQTALGDLVCHAGVNGGYHVTRERCDCPAGQHDTPCKHRAYWILVHDVRIPAERRQWAHLRRRQGGKVAA